MLPMRREKDVLVQELPDEILVYDVKRNKALCLNRTAALVWRHCDGRTTVAEMAKILQKELSLPAEEQIVWHTLHRLQRAHLLPESTTPPAKIPAMSRRDWVRQTGRSGGPCSCGNDRDRPDSSDGSKSSYLWYSAALHWTMPCRQELQGS